MPYVRVKKLPLNTKLIIYEYKERFPAVPAKYIAEFLGLQYEAVEKLFTEGEIEVPSKMNYDGRRKEKIHDR
jgi:hypothetical protein